ncbi:MAG: TIR domain-containing protein [Rubrobacter sp.]|nr:TIR domain-containing protein [Rubrobacter sp.]
MSGSKQYDVALSFAGEDREYVRSIAENLKTKGVGVFYDDFEKVALWGENLTERFVDIYMKRARHAVLFISEHYRDKVWSRLERRAALARALTEDQAYILPARFDDTEITGLLPTVAYIDLRRLSPAEFSVMICEKIGHDLSQTKANLLPPPQSRTPTGTATFDYSNFDGRFCIGADVCLFETMWSKAGDTSIHCCNDPQSIKGVALAPRSAELLDITDASTLDYTSRCRTPEEGRIVILQNSNSFFAALHILDIKDDTRSDDRDELTFRYWILTDGSEDFSRSNLA